MADVENGDPAGESPQPGEQDSHVDQHFLGEHLKEYPSLERFKDPQGLAKSYVELEKSFSSRVPVPKEDSSPEEWNTFKNRFRPEKADQYKMEMPGVDGLDSTKIDKWKQAFYEEGLSPTQADGLTRVFTQIIVDDERTMNQQIAQAKDETQKALQTEWGANYQGNRELVKAMLQEMGGDPLEGELATMLDHSATTSKFLYEVAKVLRSSNVVTGDGANNFGLMTVDEANKEKQSILYDSSNPLHKAYNSIHKEERKKATDRLTELNTIIAKNQR